MAQLSTQVGLVQQNPDDQIFATVIQDEVAFGPENLCLSPDEIEARLEWALGVVGLNGFRRRSTTALSGGQKQRLAIASMLALRPRILALDEPVSQLDHEGTSEVLDVIRKLNRELGVTIVMVEHRIHEVVQYSDRVVVLNEGRILSDEPMRQALNHMEQFAAMGLRLPETVEISRRFGKQQAALTIEEAVNLLSGGHKAEYRQTSEKQAVPAPDEPVIEIRGLSYAYGTQEALVLQDIDFTVRRGEKVAIMGRNGSGKSTLLSHMAGLTRPQKGTLKISKWRMDGRTRLPLGMVGLVMQNPDLMLFQSSVRREVEFGLRNMKLASEVFAARYQQAVESLSLEDLQEDPPLALSRGQRLRAAVAAVLAMRPEILLLDEPTTGQDIGNIESMMSAIAEPLQTLIFCTHDVELVIRYASRVILMDQGRIVADGEPKEVFVEGSLLASTGLRPPPSWFVGKALGLDDVFNPSELERRWLC